MIGTPKPTYGGGHGAPDDPPTHIALVDIYCGRYINAGEHCAYHGPPDWKLQPIPAAAAAAWREEYSDPLRVQRDNLQTRRVLHPDLPGAVKVNEEMMRQSTGRIGGV